MTGDTPFSGDLDTFPKLLAENARVRGDKPASREKDFGIWLSWTWGQVAEEVRAIACGLAALGVKRGDKVTICGDNRPHLYWAMTAVQARRRATGLPTNRLSSAAGKCRARQP